MRQLKQKTHTISKAPYAWPLLGVALLVQACGGGSSSDPAVSDGQGSTTETPAVATDAGENEITEPANNAEGNGNSNSPLEDDVSVVEMTFDPASAQATYQVTVRNFWSADEYPEGFPEDAHYSFIGGAVHDDTYSMWEFGAPPSTGIEDMAETGRIDILLFDEVAPFVALGSVDSLIDVRVYTDPAVGEIPGELELEIIVTQEHPLVSMVSMLGPSPDWFVGIDGQTLQIGDNVVEWMESLIVPLPLYDGGSKSDVIPVMGGPDIIPPDPIGLVAYDQATGTYQPSADEQIVGELVFTRIE